MTLSPYSGVLDINRRGVFPTPLHLVF